jgi:hypothetical protein
MPGAEGLLGVNVRMTYKVPNEPAAVRQHGSCSQRELVPVIRSDPGSLVCHRFCCSCLAQQNQASKQQNQAVSAPNAVTDTPPKRPILFAYRKMVLNQSLGDAWKAVDRGPARARVWVFRALLSR